MAIFVKRPLAAACCLCIVAVVLGLFVYTTINTVLILAGAIVFLVFLALLVLRGYSYTKIYILLLALGILLGIFRSTLYKKQTEALTACVGTQVTAVFTVEEVSHTNGYSAELIVRLETLEGEACTGKAVLLMDFASPFYRGDKVSGTFQVMPLTYANYYKNQHYQYKASGCSVILLKESTEDFSLVDHTTNKALIFFEDVRIRLCTSINSAVDGEAGNLLNAMLLGARDGLSATTTRNFQRAGVMHLLALSGLHIGILAGILERLLYAFGARKRARLVFIMLFMLGYLLLTGCTLSAMRAVLMLMLVCLAFFMKNRADALTSLFLVATLILMWQPYAVFSTSYQLTMLATFGILAFGKAQARLLSIFPKQKGKRGVLLKCIRFVISSLMITLFAGFAIFPVQWLTFGEIATITPISNLILIPLAAPFLLLGLGVLLLYPVAPFAFACRALGNLILWLTSVFAKPDTVISLQYDFLPYLVIPCVALAVVLLLIDLKKRWWLAFTPMLALVIGFVCCLLISRILSADQLVAVYRTSGKNESIGFIGNDGALLCDLSSGNTTQLQEGWQLLQEEGATSLDVLLLTHYHSAQKTALARFSDSVTIYALWLPQPRNEDEFTVFETLFEIASAHNIAVSVYSYDTALTVFGDGAFYVSEPVFRSRSKEPALALTFAFGNDILYYESAAMSEYRREIGVTVDNLKSDFYILGAHGPVPHDEIILREGEIGTVLIPNEDVLLLLSIREDASYLVFEEKYRFLLQ
ncbi:MAG: ComEC/Rec2 family competence protein [Clostridia bacterium]|nr:ComEC/Rec2 family competence protein [Clostridia bacterium]